MSEITIESGILDRVYLVVVNIIRVFQAVLGAVIWYLLILPLTRFFKEKNPEHFEYVVDIKKFGHGCIWRVVRILIKTHDLISGLHTPQAAFPRLLSWNIKLPLVGYKRGKSTHVIQWLGKSVGGGARASDLISFVKPSQQGLLRIINKQHIDKDSRVTVKLVWTSGENVGNSFDIPQNIKTIADIKNAAEDEVTPSHIYLPPQWLIALIELVSVVGAALAFVALVLDIIDKLKGGSD